MSPSFVLNRHTHFPYPLLRLFLFYLPLLFLSLWMMNVLEFEEVAFLFDQEKLDRVRFQFWHRLVYITEVCVGKPLSYILSFLSDTAFRLCN